MGLCGGRSGGKAGGQEKKAAAPVARDGRIIASPDGASAYFLLASMTSPNSTHFSPLNFDNCSAWTG
jgi:hypothetical protein